MWIKKLDIKGFGKIYDRAFEFSEGFNIIYGSNEAGKSTVQTFIRATLYGLKGGRASREAILSPLKKFKPWRGNDYSGSMEYALDNGDVYMVGRNFSSGTVRVFDKLFNDITDSFDVAKDKSIAFAEKHLGISESCFDRTAFIRQMESRFDEEGNKELLDRLANICQTGFEDVSFNRAQEALKEALKNYVGTEKTTTRPMDKAVSRLEELRARRENLIESRNSLLNFESLLNNVVSQSEELKSRKQLFLAILQYADKKSELEREEKKYTDLEDLFREMKSCEKELEIVRERNREYSLVREHYKLFAGYENEEIDGIGLEYQKLTDLLGESSRFENEFEQKKTEIGLIEKRLAALAGFNSLGADAESHVISLNRELEKLKRDFEGGKVEVLNEKIRNASFRDNWMKVFGGVSAASALLLFASGQFGMVDKTASYIAASITCVAAFVFILMRGNTAKTLSGLISEKRISFIEVSGMTEEIRRKQEELNSIFDSVSAGGIEEFMRQKAVFETLVQEQEKCRNRIYQIRQSMDENRRKVSELKDKIVSALLNAGVIKAGEDIREENIREFKYGARRYMGIEPSMNFARERMEQISGTLSGLFRKASGICNRDFTKLEELESSLPGMKKHIEEVTEQAKGCLVGIGRLYAASGLPMEEYEGYRNNMFLWEAENVRDFASVKYNSLSEEINSLQLKIKEYETLIQSLSEDDDEMQRIDEEIGELELRKNKLEETGVSLKTALDIMTEASVEIQQDFAPALNSTLSRIIRRVSLGRYSDIRADSSLTLKTIAPETGEIVNAALLSGGTVDQIYMALRIAMADLITSKGEKLPYIFDEIFAHYDDERTREAFRYFEELSKENQIVFFTCKGREVDIARDICGERLNVIELV